ncbi:hypothetical protein FQZ97_603520 [compost metagenome]
MLRLSSQSKSMLCSVLAVCRPTGMWTSPKVMAPFQRVLVAMVCLLGYFLKPSRFIASPSGWRVVQ